MAKEVQFESFQDQKPGTYVAIASSCCPLFQNPTSAH